MYAYTYALVACEFHELLIPAPQTNQLKPLLWRNLKLNRRRHPLQLRRSMQPNLQPRWRSQLRRVKREGGRVKREGGRLKRVDTRAWRQWRAKEE